MNKRGRQVQEQVENDEEVLDPDNCNSELNTVLTTIDIKFEYQSLDEAVMLQNTPPIHQLDAD